MANKERNKRSARKARAEERAEREAQQAASAVAVSSASAKPKASAEKEQKPAKSQGKPGLFKRISNYFSDVRVEMHRVVWPSKEELRNYSIAVIVALIVFGVAIWLVDTGIVALLVGYTSLGA